MELRPSHKKILEYLSKYGSVNTFRLSKDIKIDRREIIKLVEELTNEGLTNFRSGTVAKADKEVMEQKVAVSNEAEKEKPISKPPSIPKIIKKSRISKEKYSELEKIKGKKKRLKKEIDGLETQKNSIAQKLTKERALLHQIRKEKKETEKNLRIWEKSLSEREQAIQKREKSVSVATKRFKREKGKASKTKVLKKDIHKLESTLEDLKKKASIKKKKIKKFKEKGIKPKVFSEEMQELRKTEQPKIEEPVNISKIETQQPEIILNELWQPKINDKFHDLIEQEINLLKQKRINEARNIHLQITDMISEVTDLDQREIILKDWNRVKEFY